LVDVDADCFFFSGRTLVDAFWSQRRCVVLCSRVSQNQFHFLHRYFLFAGVTNALQGSGDAKTPLYALIVANILNIILDPMLIMGYGPFPAMGVAVLPWQR